MKAAGMLLLVLCSTLAGMLKASSLSDRVRRLEDVIALLGEMESRLRHLSPTIQGLIGSMAAQKRFAKLPFLEDCRLRMHDGAPFPESWREAVRASANALGGEEAALIASLGDVLGRVELESQLGVLRNAANLLQERLESAREKDQKKAGLYRTMGVLSGVALAIILV